MEIKPSFSIFFRIMSWNKLNTFIFLFIGNSIVTSMNIPISHCKNGTHLFECKDGTFQQLLNSKEFFRLILIFFFFRSGMKEITK